jgi:quercetin dioxygenase-like cupin family protein
MTLLFALLLAAGTEDLQVAHLNEAKFAPGKLPGVQGAPVAGDPKTEASVVYGKVQPGGKIATHWHSFAEYTVLLSGQATLTIEGKKYDLKAGDYFVIPPKTKHALECGAAAECVQLTRRAGAVDYNWIETSAAK